MHQIAPVGSLVMLHHTLEQFQKAEPSPAAIEQVVAHRHHEMQHRVAPDRYEQENAQIHPIQQFFRLLLRYSLSHQNTQYCAIYASISGSRCAYSALSARYSRMSCTVTSACT